MVLSYFSALEGPKRLQSGRSKGVRGAHEQAGGGLGRQEEVRRRSGEGDLDGGAGEDDVHPLGRAEACWEPQWLAHEPLSTCGLHVYLIIINDYILLLLLLLLYYIVTYSNEVSCDEPHIAYSIYSIYSYLHDRYIICPRCQMMMKSNIYIV